MRKIYDIGDSTRLTATFRDEASNVADPDAVTFKVRRTGGGSTTTYVHGVDAELVKDATGVYHVDLIHTTSGSYCFRWEGSGTVDTAAESHFTIKDSCFS